MKKYFKKFSIMFIMALAIIGVGAIQNGSVANAAIIGQQLTSPESGWQRYDGNQDAIDKNLIKLTGTWSHGPQPDGNSYGNTFLESHDINSYANFKFKGKKIRLLYVIDTYRSKDIRLNIDGTIYSYNAYRSNSPYIASLLTFDISGLPDSIHDAKLYSNSTGYFGIDAIDVDSNGLLLPYDESISLDKTSMNLTIGDSQQLTATTTPASASVGIAWTSSDSSIASVDEATGEVKGVSAGTCTITAITADGLTAACTVNVSPQTTTGSAVILNIEPEKNEIKLNEAVTANLTIDNIKEIAAEDIRIKYDSTKLKFLGMRSEANGIKLVKSEDNADELRVIVASEGLANVVNDKKILLKLNFQGIAPGDALVDVTKGRVSDGIEMEKDLTDDECGQAIIKIDNDILDDVNHSGEYTLLDLAIDARHLGEDPTGLPQYNTDQALNGAIDNDDLLKIGEYMLVNPNYLPNN